MPKQRDLGPQIKDKTTSLFPLTRHLLSLSLSAQNCTDAQITNEMGVYLSTPKTEKLSEDGENESLRYGVSSMQGWRATMEDAVSPLLLG
ncbi:hypothetical protein Pint_30351 [Pistacia integerrima]|uniref:Uncharacterized protein n=1 Tax=Pistacia integerrima TaxID=434235 RepID=A0ACC0X0S2_9ROSI|nr:hypothetical protein Pint_30351 [Pistacia integerrima]